MILDEEYRIAREVYQTIKILPAGHTISRAEINTRLRASSDQRRNDLITKAIRHMVHLGQIQKRMDPASCAVYFWTLDNINKKGEAIRWDPTEPAINYLIDPPPPPPPPPPPQPTPAPTQSPAPPKRERIPKELHDQLSKAGKEEYDVEDEATADLKFERDLAAFNPEEEDDSGLYMMRDTKSKKHRILLRADGDTVRISLEEIEFIRGLKSPFITL